MRLSQKVVSSIWVRFGQVVWYDDAEVVAVSWISIVDVVQRMWPRRDSVPPVEDIRIRAAVLAGNVIGPRTVAAQPSLINLAALTLSMDRLVVYRLTADAAEQVRSTELRSMPGRPPRLLRRPFIIESRRPERFSLFGETASLAGYELGGRLFLIGFEYPDGVHVEPVRISWEERDIEATTVASPYVETDIREHRAWAERAAEWIVTLGALLEAEGTPILAEDWGGAEDQQRRHGSPRGRGHGNEAGWLIRRVSLTPQAAHRVQSRVGEESAGPAEDVGLQREGLVLGETWVRGHLRRQPYGPGRELRKWVYIEGYEARRWMSARPLRIDVDVG